MSQQINFVNEWKDLQDKIKSMKAACTSLRKSFPTAQNVERTQLSDSNKSFIYDSGEESEMINSCYKKSLLIWEKYLLHKKRKKERKLLNKYSFDNHHKVKFKKNQENSVFKKLNYCPSPDAETNAIVCNTESNKNCKHYFQQKDVSVDKNDTSKGISDDIVLSNNYYKVVQPKKQNHELSPLLELAVKDKIIGKEFMSLESVDCANNKSNHLKESLSNTHLQNENEDVYIISAINSKQKFEIVSSNCCSISDDEDSDVILLDDTSSQGKSEDCDRRENIAGGSSLSALEDIPCIDLSGDDELLVEKDDDCEEIIIPDLDLTEEPVDFSVPQLHLDENVNELTEEQAARLKAKGIKIRTGKWSKEEEKLLIRNFNDFKSRFEFDDARLLLGIGSTVSKNKSQLREIKKFIRAKHFYVRLGKDLNYRTLWSIYRKARHFLHPLRQKETKDLTLLFNLVKRYGPRWELIAKKFGVPAVKCQFLYEYNMNAPEKGKWTPEETQKMMLAIKEQINNEDLSVKAMKTIDWSKVSAAVGTRNSIQCSKKCYFNIKVQCSKEFDRSQKAKLVLLLKNEFLVDDEVDIDWKKLYPMFKNVSPSIVHLRRKWLIMKNSAVHESSSYKELLWKLTKKYCF